MESSPVPPPVILGSMGFNPHRVHRRSPVDYLLVGAALVLCLGLVLWAVLG